MLLQDGSSNDPVVGSSTLSSSLIHTATSSSSASSRASLSSTCGISTIPTPSEATCSENRTTEVGASVGAALGVMLLATVAWVVILQRRLTRGNQSPTSKNGISQVQESGYYVDEARGPPAKLPEIDQLPEMDNLRRG